MKDGRALRFQNGFTIIELLVVIVVIAILAVIITVAYNGITAQAEQAKVLSTIDVYEKALRLYKSEKGGVPPTMLTSAPANSMQYPNPAYPNYYESTSYGCVPGAYPASGGLRAGECQSVLMEFTPDSTGTKEPLARVSAIAWPSLDTALAPAYISQLPVAPNKNDFSYSYSYHIDNWGGRAGTIKSSIDARGVNLYQYSNEINISYLVPGDKQCGRGTKEMINIAEYFQAIGYQDISSSAATVTSCVTKF